MTASKKKTVRTRRGVEPAGRPARREVELGKKSTNELVLRLRRRRRQLLGPDANASCISLSFPSFPRSSARVNRTTACPTLSPALGAARDARRVERERRARQLRAGGAVGGVAREANFRARARARAHSRNGHVLRGARALAGRAGALPRRRRRPRAT